MNGEQSSDYHLEFDRTSGHRRAVFVNDSEKSIEAYAVSHRSHSCIDEVAQVLAEDVVTRLSLSPDRKALLYACEEFRKLKVKLAILLVGGGPLLRTLDAPGRF
jgi:hypothetical protein